MGANWVQETVEGTDFETALAAAVEAAQAKHVLDYEAMWAGEDAYDDPEDYQWSGTLAGREGSGHVFVRSVPVPFEEAERIATEVMDETSGGAVEGGRDPRDDFDVFGKLGAVPVAAAPGEQLRWLVFGWSQS